MTYTIIIFIRGVIIYKALYFTAVRFSNIVWENVFILYKNAVYTVHIMFAYNNNIHLNVTAIDIVSFFFLGTAIVIV